MLFDISNRKEGGTNCVVCKSIKWAHFNKSEKCKYKIICVDKHNNLLSFLLLLLLLCVSYRHSEI